MSRPVQETHEVTASATKTIPTVFVQRLESLAPHFGSSHIKISGVVQIFMAMARLPALKASLLGASASGQQLSGSKVKDVMIRWNSIVRRLMSAI
mmetsp:Transcript_98727/g.174245  ORF Transcript_98727/g.174245 Transcript_98727/m.174245 type:complete len:95 (-) Transcript_98727:640-924(-)